MSAAIRPASASDLHAIRRVLIETWHATYDPIFGVEKVTEITDRWHSLEALNAQLSAEGTAFLVAERKGAILATLYAKPLCGGALSLERLYVLPEAQGQGLGRLLYHAMLARFPAASSVKLEVEPKNAPAIAFYGRMGFSKVGQGGACGGDVVAAISHIVMEKRLSPSTPAAS